MAQSGDEFWALVIDGDAGTRVRAFRSADLARAYLAAFVRDRSHMVAGEGERYTLEEFCALSDKDAVAAYFNVSEEWFHLELVTVEG